MNFPKPCTDCNRSGWSPQCKCDHAMAIMHYRKHCHDYHAPIVSTEHATVCVEMMSAIPFFPTDGGARVLIASEVAAICSDEAQALWLARRMARLYSSWPGISEMRRMFCATYMPYDGIDPVGHSEIYGDRFPNNQGNYSTRAALDAPVYIAPRQIEGEK